MTSPSPGVDVRAATAGDLAALTRLCAEHLTACGEGVGSDRIARAIELALAPRSTTWMLIALRSGMPCGVLLGNPAVSVRHGGALMRVELLYVTPLYRRRGVGRTLLEFVYAEARRNGIAAVEVVAEPADLEAINLLRDLGFRPRRCELFVTGDCP